MTKITNTCTVELIDQMGDDLTVVDAARVSFDKTSTLDENCDLRGKDAKLIGYLARHRHWTPFGHVMVTLRLKMPVFVARQWMRSTVGCARNEISRRYVDAPPEFFLPDVLHARPEGSIKQGAGEAHENSGHYQDMMTRFYDMAAAIYGNMIADGIAPEEARMILPLAHMTEFYETGSLAYFARVVGLRRDSHAQGAIRELAALVDQAVAPVAPVAWAALKDAGEAVAP